MQSINEYSCKDFTRELASKAPVPGGGGAAALAGAMAAALCSMAGNLTVGKKKYEVYEADLQANIARCETLRLKFLQLIDDDAEAFEPLSAAYRIPKDDPTRAEVLEKTTAAACAAPMEMVRCCAQTAELLEEMLEKGSVLLVSDVGCGALLCRAAMESAALNVYINTKSLQDRALASAMENEIDSLQADSLPRLDQIAVTVKARLRG